MGIVLARDAIHINVSHLPPGQACGYTTGTPDIRWVADDWKAHPHAVRICQDALASDHTADVLDVERGAASIARAPGWYRNALSAFEAGARPGQRHPAIYISASSVTALADEMVAMSVRSGPALFVANWSLTDAQAAAEVAAASGPFPIIGIQADNGPFYDTDVLSSSWLHGISVAPGTRGPYRHVLGPGGSLAAMARNRGTTVAHLLQVSSGAYTTDDAQRVTPGLVVYTTNP